MHEVGVMQDLLRRAEAVAVSNGGRVSCISLRVGPASGISADAARSHAEALALERWGYAPRIEVDSSDEEALEAIRGVTLVSIRLEE